MDEQYLDRNEKGATLLTRLILADPGSEVESACCPSWEPLTTTLRSGQSQGAATYTPVRQTQESHVFNVELTQ